MIDDIKNEKIKRLANEFSTRINEVSSSFLNLDDESILRTAQWEDLTKNANRILDKISNKEINSF